LASIDLPSETVSQSRRVCDHAFKNSSNSTWNVEEPKKIAGEVTAINVRKTDATMVLRSSLNWIAPVPQKLGLTSIVEIDETDWEKDKRLLVPFAGEDYEDVTFDVTVPDASDGAYRVTYEHGSQLGEVTCRTDLLENYTAPGGSLRFMADGWVSSDPEAAEFFRLKARVEERSASLLVCYHSLLSYPTPPPRKPDQIGVSRDKKDGYPDLDPSQIRWLATAGFVSLFDTLLIGLRMPMRVTQPGIVTPGPRSTLLTALHGLLMSALETAKPDEGESEESVPEEEPVWDMLYKHVLEAMSDWVDDGWQGMRDLLREEDWDRAPKLKKYFDSKLESEIDHATVVAELSELALILEDEAGLEAVLVKILDRAIVEKSLAGKLGLADGGYLRTALSEAFAAFKLFLDQQLNAAEILRRDVGRAVMRALGDYAKTHQQDSMRKDIEKALQTADWFVRLLNGPVVVDPPALDHLSTGLDKSFGELPPKEPKNLTDFLTERFATLDENHNLVGGAAYELITDTIAGAAFRPDPSPQPLPLLLAEGLDPEKLDKVNQRINGIGVVIAVTAPEWIVDVEVGRTNNDATRAHASLVRLDAVDDDGTPTGVVLSLASVLPALPVLNAGSSELFITFSGDPLNGVNLADSGQGGAILDDQQENEQKAGKPPYKVDDVTVGTAEHLTRPPPLAYGLDYAARAFWVPNSGALPHQLRAEESDPFSPGDMKKHSDWPTDDDLKPYLRCTAISEITLEAAASNNRIGKVPEGVFPLAMDYPRRVISRFDDGSQTIDLFRRADGTGALSEDLLQETIPERETAAKVTLRDVHIDDNAKLVVEKWTDAGGPGERLGIEVDPNNHDIWHIRVDPGGGPFWLRLTLQSVGEGGNAACSFADPEQDTPGEGAGVASRESERPPAPLLLLGQNVSPVSAEEGEGKKARSGNLWVSLSSDRWRLGDLQESVKAPAGGIKGPLLLLGAMVDKGSAVIAARA
jgi:hypothetical protein